MSSARSMAAMASLPQTLSCCGTATGMSRCGRFITPVYPCTGQEYDALSPEEVFPNEPVDPGGAGEAVGRRGAVSLAHPGAVRVERRVHAVAADRAAEGVRGAREGHRRAHGEEARHVAPQVLQDRRRHGGSVRGDERGLRQELAA